MKIRLSELRSIIKEEVTRLLEALDPDIEALNKELSGAKWVGVDAGTAKDWSAALGDFQKATKSPENVSMLKAAKEKVRNVLKKIVAKKEGDGAPSAAPADVATAEKLMAKLGEGEEVLDEAESDDVVDEISADRKKRHTVVKALEKQPGVDEPYAVYQSMVQKGFDVPPIKRKKKAK